MQAQHELAANIKNRLRLDSPEHIKGTTEKAAGLEVFNAIIGTAPSARNDVLELLLSDGNSKTLDKIAYRIEKKYVDAIGDKNRRNMGDYPFLPMVEYRDIAPLFKKTLQEKSNTLWKNFWSAPIEIRAVLFENILFPEAKTDLASLKEGYDFIAKRLFPDGEPHSETSRAFLDAYFQVLDPVQRRLFLSAAMVAAQKSQNSNEKLSIGQRLAMVLELLGPAETKLGQAIHSHPDTPEEIRKGVERLKAHAAPPERWELTEWIEKLIPASERKLYKRIGKVLGSGSYYVTVEVELKKGGTEVLQILRPYALERSQRGFDLLGKMAQKLIGVVEPETLSIVQDAIKQAHERAIPETNAETAEKQFNLAKELYHGSKIQVNDTEILLEVPKIRASGKGYRRMQKGEGVHFNELPYNTAAEKTEKENIARAYLAYELMLILNGKQYDLDRHQAQLRIIKTGDNQYKLTLFDFGGLSLTPPSPEDLKQLGKAIHDAFIELQKGTLLNVVIDKIIKAERKAGQSVENLVRLQQAILALNDFKKFIPNQDLAQILKSVQEGGYLHPEIQQGAVTRAFEQNTVAQLMGFFSDKKDDGNLCIKIKRQLGNRK